MSESSPRPFAWLAELETTPRSGFTLRLAKPFLRELEVERHTEDYANMVSTFIHLLWQLCEFIHITSHSHPWQMRCLYRQGTDAADRSRRRPILPHSALVHKVDSLRAWFASGNDVGFLQGAFCECLRCWLSFAEICGATWSTNGTV